MARPIPQSGRFDPPRDELAEAIGDNGYFPNADYDAARMISAPPASPAVIAARKVAERCRSTRYYGPANKAIAEAFEAFADELQRLDNATPSRYND